MARNTKQDQLQMDETTSEETQMDQASEVQEDFDFEVVSLPTRKHGLGPGSTGPRGPRNLAERMAEIIHASDDPDAALQVRNLKTGIPIVSATPVMTAWAKERGLRLTMREGFLYLAKRPAQADEAENESSEG